MRTPPQGSDLARHAFAKLRERDMNPWLARAWVLRDAVDESGLLRRPDLDQAPPMRGLDQAIARLSGAIKAREAIMVAADYDCDGATSATLAVTALKAMGAVVDFVVPNRFVHGYGLTPAVVDLIAERQPQTRVIVTVDNGISSVAGVAHANALGMEVVVTDHHLPGAVLPDAAAIVDPKQAGCPFPSKNMAGCGVILYVLSALRDALARAGAPGGNLDLRPLLDLVALGTVADVVPLDALNRRLVSAGIARIRAGRARPGLAALFDVANRSMARAASSDFGFAVGPRINAAGRLSDMTTGIRCLLSTDEGTAGMLAAGLVRLNTSRKEMEARMREVATEGLALGDPTALTRVACGEDFNEGVVGIVASRIKEREGTPAVVFAPASSGGGMLKGSARGVAGMNLRDALDRVDKLGQSPAMPDGLLEKFGGHAMAAGLTLRADRLDAFKAYFEQAVHEALGGVLPSRQVLIDADLPNAAINVDTAREVSQAVWGAGFEEPRWRGRFDLVDARAVGADKNHVKMRLRRDGDVFDAIQFFREDVPAPGALDVVYRLGWNVYRGHERAELLVEMATP